MILSIPAELLAVPYNGKVVPEIPWPSTLEGGCNCQVFAYAVLRHFGVPLPPFRSSELWEDCLYTVAATEFEPLDLMLYNHDERSWGAHVGVYIGDRKVIHLSKSVGAAVIQSHGDFAVDPKYVHFIGAKRVIKRSEITKQSNSIGEWLSTRNLEG